MTQNQLLELLKQARENNERDKINGILLYTRNFMFEGEEESRRAWFDKKKILADRRQ